MIRMSRPGRCLVLTSVISHVYEHGLGYSAAPYRTRVIQKVILGAATANFLCISFDIAEYGERGAVAI